MTVGSALQREASRCGAALDVELRDPTATRKVELLVGNNENAVVPDVLFELRCVTGMALPVRPYSPQT